MHPDGMVCMMTMEQRIKAATAYKGKSQAALARALDTTPSNFNQKLKRGTFSESELHKIAAALDAVYVCAFEFADGTRL